MTSCKRCGKELPAQKSIFDKYTPNGLLWLATVVVTVGGMAIALAFVTIQFLLESELSSTWKLSLMLLFVAIITTSIILSATRILRSRRLAQYCTDCVAALIADGSSRAEEYGAHKIRMKK